MCLGWRGRLSSSSCSSTGGCWSNLWGIAGSNGLDCLRRALTWRWNAGRGRDAESRHSALIRRQGHSCNWRGYWRGHGLSWRHRLLSWRHGLLSCGRNLRGNRRCDRLLWRQGWGCMWSLNRRWHYKGLHRGLSGSRNRCLSRHRRYNRLFRRLSRHRNYNRLSLGLHRGGNRGLSRHRRYNRLLWGLSRRIHNSRLSRGLYRGRNMGLSRRRCYNRLYWMLNRGLNMSYNRLCWGLNRGRNMSLSRQRCYDRGSSCLSWCCMRKLSRHRGYSRLLGPLRRCHRGLLSRRRRQNRLLGGCSRGGKGGGGMGRGRGGDRGWGVGRDGGGGGSLYHHRRYYGLLGRRENGRDCLRWDRRHNWRWNRHCHGCGRNRSLSMHGRQHRRGDLRSGGRNSRLLRLCCCGRGTRRCRNGYSWRSLNRWDVGRHWNQNLGRQSF